MPAPSLRRTLLRIAPILLAVLLVQAVPAAPPAAPASGRPASLRARATSTTALTVASAANGNGTAVLLMATVDTASGALPGGSVVFTAEGKRIGEVPVSKGAASLTVTALPTGLSTLSASFQGDANLLPSTSATVRFYNDDQD